MDDLIHASPASAGMSVLRHPLEPLTAAEIRAVMGIIKASPDFGPAFLFETIELKEPPRAALTDFSAGKPGPREARANVFLGDAPGLWRLTVSLPDAAITSKLFLATARPMIQLEQFLQIEGIVRAHPDFIAACAKRGITDMSMVCVDPWSAGNFDIPGEENGFLSHTFSWLRLRENENFYAHPIEGINAVVDIKAGKVLRVDDYGAKPIPMGEFNYEAQFFETFRAPLKPLDIVQPEGASFTLNGHAITWDNWSLVIGFNAREGLTLHDIRYDGRPIVNRASLAEMVVPYGVPDGGHFRKNVFDIGEYGLGKLTNSLTLGCDCLGTIAYLDVDLNTMTGDIFHIEKAICIHEEDDGILWKHWDFRTERTEVRRGRKLVISSIATVGNYEYASYWYHTGRDDRVRDEGDGDHQYLRVRAGPADQIWDGSGTGAAGAHPSACVLRAAGNGGGWAWQFLRGMQHLRRGGFEESLRQRVLSRGDGVDVGAGGVPEGEPGDAKILEGDQSQSDKPYGQTGRLQDLSAECSDLIPQSGLLFRQAVELHREPCLGHQIRPGRALPGRRVYEPFGRQGRRRRLRQAGPESGEHGSGAVARVRRASPAADGGFPGPALHHRRVQIDAERIFRPESGHRCRPRRQQGEQTGERLVLLRLRHGRRVSKAGCTRPQPAAIFSRVAPTMAAIVHS
jgi:hypothetical protein